jgi:hypothetical protein
VGTRGHARIIGDPGHIVLSGGSRRGKCGSARRVKSMSPDETFVPAVAAAMHLRRDGRPGHPARRPAPGTGGAGRGEEAARWCVEQYPRPRHHGLVVSDAHGSAAHLAAALDVPWLPLPPDGAALPAAYRELLEYGLAAGAPVLVITTDGRRGGNMPLPVVMVAGQARRAGLAPAVMRVSGSALSAKVAQAHRSWLHAAGRCADRLLVECGPRLDAVQVLRAGLVPYWCPDAAPRHADTLTWWLAGEERYTSVELMLHAPDRHGAAARPRDNRSVVTRTRDDRTNPAGTLDAWSAVARFARQCAEAEPGARRALPERSRPARHAARLLRAVPHDPPLPRPLGIDDALRAITTG